MLTLLRLFHILNLFRYLFLVFRHGDSPLHNFILLQIFSCKGKISIFYHVLSPLVFQFWDKFGPMFSKLLSIPHNCLILLLGPLFLDFGLIEMVGVSLSTLFRCLKILLIRLMKYFLGNLVPMALWVFSE